MRNRSGHVIPGVAFFGSMDGHLRAYSTIDGKILWDYDTAKDLPTVNRCGRPAARWIGRRHHRERRRVRQFRSVLSGRPPVMCCSRFQ